MQAVYKVLQPRPRGLLEIFLDCGRDGNLIMGCCRAIVGKTYFNSAVKTILYRSLQPAQPHVSRIGYTLITSSSPASTLVLKFPPLDLWRRSR